MIDFDPTKFIAQANSRKRVTRVYSCSKGTTTAELIGACKKQHIDIWFPEINHDDIESPYLYHEAELPAVAMDCIGETIVTVSDIIILSLLHEIEGGRLRTDELELYCAGQRVYVGVDGDLCGCWGSDNGFFDERFNLLIHEGELPWKEST